MVVEHGKVIEVRDGSAVVRTCAPAACADCAHGDACCSFGSSSRTIEVADPLGVHPGQMVRVSVSSSVTAAAVVFLYGLPVAGLVVGAVIGSAVADAFGGRISTNVGAAVGALVLLAGAVVGARVADRRFRSNPDVAPRITAIVDEAYSEGDTGNG